jgi:Trk K+ transport system NAD-binding subunit
MAFPLTTVLKTAPGLISAAADIIGMIRKNKQQVPQADTAKLDELNRLIEQQAKVLEELALNNRNLVLAVRNNRLMAMAAMMLALFAIGVSLFWH